MPVKTHGLTHSRTHVSWRSMKARCFQTARPQYAQYGGRGITVCERWMRFENFLADMGVCPEKFTLDRIDVNGNYEPSNCRWADSKTQASNKRNTRKVELNGVLLTFEEFSKTTGVPLLTLRNWHAKNQNIEARAAVWPKRVYELKGVSA